eukprot:c19725_g1_i1 orf=554-2938(-)
MADRQKKKSRKKKGDKSRGGPMELEEDASIPWMNVTPDDPIAVLAGSNQGGFMCLEEVDGDFYAQLSGIAMEPSVEGEQTLAVPSLDGSTKQKSAKKRKRGHKKETKEVNSSNGFDASSSDKELIKTKKRREAQVLDPILDTCEAEKCSTAQMGDALLEGEVLESACTGHQDDGFEGEDFQDEKLSAWTELRLHDRIMKGLSALGFTQPTSIQKACIPAAAHQGKDVIGAAETGSGKTLAYVIPILQRLLDEEEKYFRSVEKQEVVDGLPSKSSISRGFLRVLIVTPTRELSLQVCKHFREAAKFTTIKVVPIVGGMSLQKQERLLKQRPDAIVGTPGRLWELMSAGDQHLTELHQLSFFVLDEADRMVEKGHFQELQSIMSMLPVVDQRRASSGDADVQGASLSVDMASTDIRGIFRRQTFVFSATLALPVGFKKKLKKGHFHSKQHSKGEEYSVALLSERAGVRPNAAIIDLTSQNIVADKLEESIIHCREDEKDLFLYYLLKLHGQGRAIVFCTSIAALRHVAAILSLLQMPVWPLHAQMQQRQRLKAMDRFQSRENSCLISTDVAARGLDIPGVRTVIHYQLPHSAEVYVHRSGRTARASKDGCSILLVTPSDQMKYNTLCNALSKKDGLPSFPCNSAYIPAIMKRIQLAQKIDDLSRKNSQLRAKTSWFKRNADALEVDIEEDIDENGNLSEKKKSFELKKLHQELKVMLDQPLEPKAFSHRFITGAGMSPLLAGQLKDYAKQKIISKQLSATKKAKKAGIGSETKRRGLVVIGQEMVEPLAVLRLSRK